MLLMTAESSARVARGDGFGGFAADARPGAPAGIAGADDWFAPTLVGGERGRAWKRLAPPGGGLLEVL
jgi:hypothetical protein